MTLAKDYSRRRGAVHRAVLTSGSGVLPVVLIPTLYPRVAAEFAAFTPGLLGVATSGFFVASSVSAATTGRLADRIGTRGSMVLVSGGTVLIVAALASSWSVPVLIGVMIAGGIVQSLAVSSSNLIMADTLDGTRPATLFGIKQSVIPAVSMAASVLLAAISTFTSWRIIVLAFMGVPLTLLYLGRASARQDMGTDTKSEDSSSESSKSSRLDPAGGVDLPLVSLAIIGLLSGLATSILSTYGVWTLTESSWSPSAAGWVWTAAALVSLAIRVLVGASVDRWQLNAVSMIGWLLAGGAAGSMIIALGGPIFAMVGTILAYGFGWSTPGLLHYALARTFIRSVGRSTGVVQVCMAMGISVGPVAFTLLESRSSLAVGWSFAAALWGFGAIAAALSTPYFRDLTAEEVPSNSIHPRGTK